MNKKLLTALLSATILVGSGSIYANVQSRNIANENERTILNSPIDEKGGARAALYSADHQESPYYKAPDFYNMKSSKSLTILPKFKTYQQSTEWSCGNAAALMVMNYLGDKKITELELAKAMKSSTDLDVPNAEIGTANNFGEYGTSLPQMAQYFKNSKTFKILDTNYDEKIDSNQFTKAGQATPNAVGNKKPTFSPLALYTSDNVANSTNFVEDAKDSHFVKWLKKYLDKNIPIMVEWGDWGGHWLTIIGYDNMSTPTVSDDVLIFADSYDVTDHSQDGYYVYPLERFFTMWSDYNIVQKPYQLQNYIVVSPVK